MACAGYLVLDNARVVYAELLDGDLICSDVGVSVSKPNPVISPSTKTATRRRSAADCPEMTLPLLAVHPMPRRVSLAVDGKDFKASDSTVVPRVLRLSGRVVEVKDKSCAGLDLPLSFQVITNSVTQHPDGSCSTSYADSVVLSAVDHVAKLAWMQQFRRWRRYGWRNVVPIAAEESDKHAMQQALVRWQCRQGSAPSLLAYGFSRSRRRRVSCAMSMYRVLEQPEDARLPTEAERL